MGLLENIGDGPDWDMVPDHIRPGIRGYIEEGRPTGDFLNFVFEGNLMNAAVYADDVNVKALGSIAKFMVWYAPSQCYGSPEKVAAWKKAGGLKGQKEKSNAD